MPTAVTNWREHILAQVYPASSVLVSIASLRLAFLVPGKHWELQGTKLQLQLSPFCQSLQQQNEQAGLYGLLLPAQQTWAVDRGGFIW